jgi:DNA-directed RNA polymerase subunit L
MELRPVQLTDRSLEVRLVDEDFSIADILRTELLGLKNVVFAGVQSPHPLLREVVVRLEVAEGEPLKVLTTAGEAAQARIRELASAAAEVFSRSEGARP